MISSRPTIIADINTHFAVFGRGSKLPEGPIMSPKPGPTFATAVPAPDHAVSVSKPSIDKMIAVTAKVKKNKKK